MSINHYVKTFDEFVTENLDLTNTTPFDHADEKEFDDSETPDLPEELKTPKQKYPLNRFLVFDDIDNDQNEEGEPG